MQRLTDREFSGKIIPGKDPKNCGRYCVLIPELMYNIYDKEEGFIYCSNHVTNHRNSSSDNGIYGQYFPLYSGTKVIVKFNSEDLETGYIDRIISDHYENSMPLGISSDDRDQYYQILRTIANDLIAITHDTSQIPKNGIHLYHKGDNVNLIFDESGIHIYTKKDHDQQIDGESFIKVNGNVNCVFSSELNIQISGPVKITTSGNCDISSGGVCNVSSSGDCNVLAGGTCNIDGSSVNINCKKAIPASKTNISNKEKTTLIPFDTKKEISDDFI
jgi:hypothetical protein